MDGMRQFKRSLLLAAWFMILTFPLLVVRVNTIEKTVLWRWRNLLYVGLGTFVVSWLWPWVMARRDRGLGKRVTAGRSPVGAILDRLPGRASGVWRALKVLGVMAALAYPLFASIYQVNIMASALIYVGLGLGLNIVVGLAGLLDLGYVAFFAIGAYTVALLTAPAPHGIEMSFWLALPISVLMAALSGVLLGIPVLGIIPRLRRIPSRSSSGRNAPGSAPFGTTATRRAPCAARCRTNDRVTETARSDWP